MSTKSVAPAGSLSLRLTVTKDGKSTHYTVNDISQLRLLADEYKAPFSMAELEFDIGCNEVEWILNEAGEDTEESPTGRRVSIRNKRGGKSHSTRTVMLSDYFKRR